MKPYESRTEYNNIEEIGRTHFDYRNEYERLANAYYRKMVINLLKKWLADVNDSTILDLGCSKGTYYDFWKSLGFNRIIGVDISSERLSEAKEKGYEVYNENASNLHFADEELKVVVCNDMIVHVISDADKKKILAEVHRVTAGDGRFIFSYPNAYAQGFMEDTVVKHCSFLTRKSVLQMLRETGWTVLHEVGLYGPMKNLFLRGISRISGQRFYFENILPLAEKIRGFSLNEQKDKVIYVYATKPQGGIVN